jgi:hypothetical protein
MAKTTDVFALPGNLGTNQDHMDLRFEDLVLPFVAIRNISVGTPSRFATTALRLNLTRAVGRENVAKASPVSRANPMRPIVASALNRTFATVGLRSYRALRFGHRRRPYCER